MSKKENFTEILEKINQRKFWFQKILKKRVKDGI